jgi:putative endonuclease
MKKTNSKERGAAGEAMAAAFIEGLGMKVLARNYRFRKAEVDILAEDGQELVVLEVKIRQNNSFGYPEEFISRKQASLLKMAGYNYREEKELSHPVRFDIIAVSIDELEIKHFRDAF